MKNKTKSEIVSILKQFEQQDYKMGGVSIAPEMYDAISNKIFDTIISGYIKSAEHFRKQRDNGLIETINKPDNKTT